MVLLGFRRLPLFVGFALLHLSASVPAQAAILTAIEDNNVLKSAANTVQGTIGSEGEQTSFSLKVASTGQGNARLGYLKFDLSSIAQSLANEGTFTITSTAVNTTPYTLRVYALNSGDPNFNWSENTITYNNRPAFNNGSDPLVALANVTQVGMDISVPTATASSTPFSFSFADLENYRQSDDTLTFIAIVTTQTDNAPSFSFASSENSTAAIRPTLNVTAIPEPTTLDLLGFGLAGCILWRLRK